MSFTISDHEQLQKLMNESPQAKEVIQKLMDQHQYTISKMSHELRNPLSLVYSTLQLIESQHPEVTTFRYWKELHGDIEYMNLLLKEFSDFNNGDHLKKEFFSSYEFFSQICLSFAASTVHHSLEFTSKIPDTLPLICGDKLKLQEVFINLLKNAREAIQGNGAISLDVSEQDGCLYISVSDNGCGIPAEHLETIFDMFITHKMEGTGLGLAISKRIIEAHGGTIQVSSIPCQKTCFTVMLPVA